MSRRLLLFYLFALKTVCPIIIQSPRVLKVLPGGTAVLTCDLVDLMAHCDVISWYKSHPRTKQLSATTAINTEPENSGPCLGVIRNITAGDSGTYYCTAVHTIMSIIGSGSRVIVKEPNPQLTVTLYIPDESNSSDVLLQCLVMGAVPSEVRVSWVVSHTVLTGWTESAWTDDSGSALEFTRAHVLVPSESWMDNVECVVELDGRTISKSLKRGSDLSCTWLMYLGFGTAFLIILATVIVAVSSLTARRDKLTLRSGGSESHFRHRNGKRGTHTVEGSCTMEVQYASLDLIRIGQGSSTDLSRAS
ncbi:hypothetical protein AOLI_G00301200 [Acnodon oligacanthus]